MSLSRRERLTPALDRIQSALDAMPTRFVSRNTLQIVRVLNKLDAARDAINAAHKEINREINR